VHFNIQCVQGAQNEYETTMIPQNNEIEALSIGVQSQ
jgi:hypothetical protein